MPNSDTTVSTSVSAEGSQQMADVLDSKHIQLPRSIADDIVSKTRDSSVIQTLSAARPVIFQDTTNVLFNKEPEAEFVDEGQAHKSMDVEFKAVQGVVRKAHVITSQNDTAPKPRELSSELSKRLIPSQNDTAPKHTLII